LAVPAQLLDDREQNLFLYAEVLLLVDLDLGTRVLAERMRSWAFTSSGIFLPSASSGHSEPPEKVHLSGPTEKPRRPRTSFLRLRINTG
jgi:hypothetical protein